MELHKLMEEVISFSDTPEEVNAEADGDAQQEQKEGTDGDKPGGDINKAGGDTIKAGGDIKLGGDTQTPQKTGENPENKKPENKAAPTEEEKCQRLYEAERLDKIVPSEDEKARCKAHEEKKAREQKRKDQEKELKKARKV
jgi:hypothetical protein